MAMLLAFGCRAEPTPAPPGTPAAPTPSSHLRVRRPAVSGSWYPSDPGKLASLVDGWLEGEPPADCQHLPLALVAPHAGYRWSGPTAAKAFATVRGCNVRRVWLLAPSHHLQLRGVALHDVDAFRTPLGDLPVDRDALERLAASPRFSWLPASGDGGEHSQEMELPLLQRSLGAFELVPLLVGSLDLDGARQVADTLRSEIGPGDLVVVSSDFTHFGPNYGYQPFHDDLPERISRLDHSAWAHVATPDPAALVSVLASTHATICGRMPLTILAALLDPSSRGTQIAYARSGEIAGDWTNSVSYLAGRVDGPPWSGRGPSVGAARLVPAGAAAALWQLAHESLEHWFQAGEALEVDPSTLPPEAGRELGAFVTLEEQGHLRGCIGEIVPRRAAWQAVADHAVDAAIHDPRFEPVSASELPALDLEVTLLAPSHAVASARDVILGRHGIVLSLGGRRATFLPQVAPEEGWDRDTTLRFLARKAGIPQSMIPRATIEVYEGQVIRGPE